MTTPKHTNALRFNDPASFFLILAATATEQ